jgi:hypothetical protein
MAVTIVKESLMFLITTSSVPNHCIFEVALVATWGITIAQIKSHMRKEFILSLFVTLHEVTLQKKKKINFTIPKQVFFSRQFSDH